MLKVNVGLSRKLSQNFNSQGMSVNLEAEITAPIHDQDAVIQQVKEIFDLADEALDQQTERMRSIDAQASHDAPPPAPTIRTSYGNPRSAYTPQSPSVPAVNGNGYLSGNRPTTPEPTREEPATNKQISYLLSIGKRQRRTTAQLEQEVQQLLQKAVGIYDLTKREAAQAIDALTKAADGSPAPARF